jgi:hypothetical protein
MRYEFSSWPGAHLSRAPKADIQMEGKNVLRVGKMKKLEKT